MDPDPGCSGYADLRISLPLICVYLFRRQKRIDEFDGEMLTPYRERADEITDEIRKNEDNTNRLKDQLHQLYKEMKALDPMPEKVSLSSR